MAIGQMKSRFNHSIYFQGHPIQGGAENSGSDEVCRNFIIIIIILMSMMMIMTIIVMVIMTIIAKISMFMLLIKLALNINNSP